MNAVEIEEAVSRLAEAPFDPEAFPYAFLEAFGNKETTLGRIKSGNTNQSDLAGGVLQRNNIHIKICPEGEVTATLALCGRVLPPPARRPSSSWRLTAKALKRKTLSMAKPSLAPSPTFTTTSASSCR